MECVKADRNPTRLEINAPDNQAAQASLKMDIGLEVSSVQSILDLVAAGYGWYAKTALRACGRPEAFDFRPLTRPTRDGAAV